MGKGGDRKAAVPIYDKLAAAPGIASELRDLAVLLFGHARVARPGSEGRDRASEPLTQSGNPWRASALDITAAAKLQAGDHAGALAIYQKLADDLAAPQALRARAAEMAAALKS